MKRIVLIHTALLLFSPLSIAEAPPLLPGRSKIKSAFDAASKLEKFKSNQKTLTNNEKLVVVDLYNQGVGKLNNLQSKIGILNTALKSELDRPGSDHQTLVRQTKILEKLLNEHKEDLTRLKTYESFAKSSAATSTTSKRRKMIVLKPQEVKLSPSVQLLTALPELTEKAAGEIEKSHKASKNNINKFD